MNHVTLFLIISLCFLASDLPTPLRRVCGFASFFFAILTLAKGEV